MSFVGKSGQMKIMQMSFMIVGVFIFFVMVGLFALGIVLSGISDDSEELAREEAISFMGVLSDMPEFYYDADESYGVDVDKLKVMMSFVDEYEDFWPVASIEFYVLFPDVDGLIECPGTDCNHYSVYDSGQSDIEKYSTYVSICERVKESGVAYDDCRVGKLVVGTTIS